jgi:Cu/Ag efflux protein CusF
MTDLKIRFVALAVAACAAAVPVLAQQKTDDHAAHHGAADLADGEIRKVDKGASKLTIKHGEIKNLDMPGMTMVFQVKDSALLDKVKAGDKVRFRAEKSDSGYVVTAIESAR